ncbi:MAG: flagellar biosynthesis anti-sigma factor FlgM [Nitrospinae bacterium CG11_big_fil_rev_8_21_14_0_20_45_15]|nr:MAG: flagellar biosynthesis anti-sigma factor FlgM [Nitrospinae bacterium CG11_big_fil_rev_8_21_14_0_20_45_15]
MNELHPATKVARRQALSKVSVAVPKATSSVLGDHSNDKVSLSASSRAQASQKPAATGTEIRRDLVNKFKTVLERGDYEVKSDEIADKMVQKIREQKNMPII